MWRLFLPSYLKAYDTLLYLDNDTLIYEDVTSFFNLILKKIQLPQ
ncbi:glycosyltransferase [Enterococcus raffinosus]